MKLPSTLSTVLRKSIGSSGAELPIQPRIVDFDNCGKVQVGDINDRFDACFNLHGEDGVVIAVAENGDKWIGEEMGNRNAAF